MKVIILVIMMLIFCSLSYAENWTDAQIVNAIYKAEGGAKAKYQYGIRSVKYASTEEARKICFNTVRNNRRRYAAYGHKTAGTFIEFLAGRYCPCRGRGISRNEALLNKNWTKNVMYFLRKGA